MAERLVTDVGGLPAGRIPQEDVKQLFWQKQMIAMFNVLRSRGHFNLDEFRRKVEEMSPEDYKHSNFYGRRSDNMIKLIAEKGLIDIDELNRRTEQVFKEGRSDG